MKNLQANTFSKSEKLCSKKIIEELFGSPARQFFVFPLRCSILFTPLPEKVPAQVMIMVPKRNFPKAVHRNYVRRTIREAYRTNKQPLLKALNSKGFTMALSFGYVSKDFITYQELDKKMKEIITALCAYIEKISPPSAAHEPGRSNILSK